MKNTVIGIALVLLAVIAFNTYRIAALLDGQISVYVENTVDVHSR